MHPICTSTPAAPSLSVPLGTLSATLYAPLRHPPSAPPSHPICAFSSPLLHLRVVRLFQLITRQIRDLDKRIINPRTSKCPAGNPATLALASSPTVACTSSRMAYTQSPHSLARILPY